MTRELLEPVVEGRLAAHLEAVLAHAVNHLGEQAQAAAGAKNRGRALQDERRIAERLDIESHRTKLRDRSHHVCGTCRVDVERGGREQRLNSNTSASQFGAQALERNSLVRRVLIEEYQAVIALERDITREDLSHDSQGRVERDRRAYRGGRRACFGRGGAVGAAAPEAEAQRAPLGAPRLSIGGQPGPSLRLGAPNTRAPGGGARPLPALPPPPPPVARPGAHGPQHPPGADTSAR